METIFGDGLRIGGSGMMGKLFGAGKRVLTGESLIHDDIYKSRTG